MVPEFLGITFINDIKRYFIMKKILFIIQSYPSERSANVLCDEKVMNELRNRGDYEIHCLTYQYDRQPIEDYINGYYIHRYKRSPLWDIYTWARHNENTIRSKIIYKMHRIVLRLKEAVTIPIYPCYEPINCILYARAAINLYKKEQFDVVFAEHNGFDTLYAGHKLKEYAQDKISFIATLWDPFSGKKNAKYLPKAYCERKIIKSEKKLLSNADTIIAMKSSESYHLKHSTEKPYFDRYIFLDIPGIVKRSITTEKDNFTNDKFINLLYAGLLSIPNRDPSFLIKMLGKTKFKDRINLIFLCSGNAVERINELRKDFAGKIIIHEYVEKKELEIIMNNVQGFLNIGGNNPNMVPSKIFEYMSYGKPIISTFEIENEASRQYLQKYPLGLCISSMEGGNITIRKLNEFFANKINQVLPFEEICSSFPLNSPKAYAAVIEDNLKKS